MPVSPGSRCTEPGCGTITASGRCPEHQRKPWANTSARNRALDKGRWLRVRAEHLRHEPACIDCGATTRLEVDHILELVDGGALYDPDNLATRCHDCHKSKTAWTRRWRKENR